MTELRGHVRLLDISHDLGDVADLLESAFAEYLDDVGRRMVQDLRRYARWAPILGWWLPLILGWMNQFISFVWEEEGRVVGHAMAMRSPLDGRRWQVANVAVAAPYRGRGIARALMETLLSALEDMGGDWVVLQVREDNPVALHLYESLGFRTVCGEIHWEKDVALEEPPNSPLPPLPFPLHPRLRGGAVRALVDRSFTPGGMWWWGARDFPRWERWGTRMARWLRLVGEEYWGWGHEGRLFALLHLRFDRRRGMGHVVFRVDRAYWGLWEDVFVRWAEVRARKQGLSRVRTITEMAHRALEEALNRAGWTPRHRLLNMRRPMGGGALEYVRRDV